jgi:TPR repeat protein
MYDIFISSKSEDYPIAEEVYKFLKDAGLSVFLASRELRKIGRAAYGESIDEVLDNVKHLIVVTSKAEYVNKENSRWVHYEWSTFHKELLSGRKNGNILTILQDVNIDSLPIGLRNYQSLPFDSFKDSVLDYVGINQQSLQNGIDSINRDYEIKISSCVDDEERRRIEEKLQNTEEERIKLYKKIEELDGEDLLNAGKKIMKMYKGVEEPFRKIAENGDAEAQYLLGKIYAEGNLVPQNYLEAEKWYQKAANQGNAEAIFAIGKMYEMGNGLKKDQRKALDWYLKSAEKMYQPAMEAVASTYEFGYDGIPINYHKAEKWYRLLVDMGSIGAICNLGRLYCYGSGDEDSPYEKENIEEKFDKDKLKALYYFMLASKHGNSEAMLMIAHMYDWDYVCSATDEDIIDRCIDEDAIRHLITIDKIDDFFKYIRHVLDSMSREELSKEDRWRHKVHWGRKSVDEGNSEAAIYVGDWYVEEGYGLDYKYVSFYDAYAYYDEALKMGSDFVDEIEEKIRDLCYELGRVCEKERDGIEAGKWYRKAFVMYLKAANQGNLPAQKKLSDMYLSGQGVPKSFEESRKWEERYRSLHVWKKED